MASVSLDESDESGTPAPVKKSKRLSSTPQVGVKMIYFGIFLHHPLDLNEKSKIGVISFQCLIVDTYGISIKYTNFISGGPTNIHIMLF